MKAKANMRVRSALMQVNKRQCDLARWLNIYEEKLSRMLRYELPDKEQDELIEVIERHAKEVKE